MNFLRGVLRFFAGSLLLVVVAVGGYAAYVVHLSQQAPLTLMSCMARGLPWSAWTCEQVLTRHGLDHDAVAELNRQAGARLPLLMFDDPAQAERILDMFLAHGVDINATDAQGMTALHTLARSGRPPKRVAMLLSRGARVDLSDHTDKTPLDLAMIAMWRHPNENQASVIRMLSVGSEPMPATASGQVELAKSP